MEQIEIYKKLKQLRKERGLTLNTFAEKIGSDYQQLSRIERGKSKLSFEMLVKMANALETPISELVPQNAPAKEAFSPSTVQPVSFFSNDLLAFILEKIEIMVEECSLSLSPSKKASLASQIYQSAMQFFQEKDNAKEAEAFISYSIDLVKTIASPK